MNDINTINAKYGLKPGYSDVRRLNNWQRKDR